MEPFKFYSVSQEVCYYLRKPLIVSYDGFGDGFVYMDREFLLLFVYAEVEYIHNTLKHFLEIKLFR
jgi:hypothetical protein